MPRSKVIMVFISKIYWRDSPTMITNLLLNVGMPGSSKKEFEVTFLSGTLDKGLAELPSTTQLRYL